jgi:hypothetical protein
MLLLIFFSQRGGKSGKAIPHEMWWLWIICMLSL